MKNYLCLFERPFELQKNGVLLFEISVFVLEIWTFIYYADLISDGVILFAAKKSFVTSERAFFVLLEKLILHFASLVRP